MSQSELPKRACLLTFDDGYIDHYKYVFPILHGKNLGALFFLPKHSFLDRKILEVNKIQFVLAAFENPSTLKQKIDEIIRKEDYSAVAQYEKDFFKADRFGAEKLSTGNIKLLIRAFVILASVLVAHISQKPCQSRSGSGNITKV